MVKVTFKKEPKETGLMSISFPNQSVNLKIKGKTFGMINAPTWQTEDNRWSISIMVTGLNNEWKWVNFKQRFLNEQYAREWIQEYIDAIMKKYTLRFED